MKPSRSTRFWGWVLIVMGVGTLGEELVRYWFGNHPIQGWPVLIGCLFGFCGFYLEDNKGALEGGQFVVESATRIIGVIRSGRRSTDLRAVVVPDEEKKK